MTVLVSVKINDGVVMAVDSATTFATEPVPQVYGHARKIVNLRKGLPIGAMVTGDGGIGSEPIDTLLKDLRRRFSGDDPAHPDWRLDERTYTVQTVAERLRAFLWDEKAAALGVEVRTSLRVCGYSSGRPLPEVWDVQLLGKEAPQPILTQDETTYGPRWAGEFEALDRLILGRAPAFVRTAQTNGLTPEQAETINAAVLRQHSTQLVMAAMPIQDAIDLARYLVETTIGYVKFTVGRAKTVGGAVEIAAITKHEGFRWVQRQHFYPAALNQDG